MVDDPIPQDDSTSSTIANLILGYVSVEAGISSEQGFSIKSLMKGVKDFDKRKRDMESFVVWVVAIMKRAMDYVCDRLGVPTFRFFNSGNPRCDDWTRRA